MQGVERDFFRTIRDAILSNPFGRTRQELDLVATGLPAETPLKEILERLVAKVGQHIHEVESRQVELAAEDRRLLEYGKLFYTFHLFCDAYDEHIRKQEVRGETCCQVVFARDVLSMLTGYGFSEPDALRLFALFFQMRRAYYFIRTIAGESRSVVGFRHALWNNVFTGDIRLYNDYLWDRMEDFSTMILGETGTGKGMAAAAIGRSGFIPFNPKTSTFSESFAKAFIAINLSQYPEQLIESELFGHKKGAFTGAVDNHQGIFARCSPCGAIFLDEIGDVSVPVQIKLLQVLQSRTFAPVGSHKVERFQGRVIAATNRDLTALRKLGAFRDDFYYRLCSDIIEVPPLRRRLAEHPGELRLLLEVTVRRILGKNSEEIVERVETYIERHQPSGYSWPGNIRELEQCIRRILLNNNYLWQQQSEDGSPQQLARELEQGECTAQQLLTRYCGHLYRLHGTYEEVARLTNLDRRTARKYILAAIEATKGNG
ncbi:sigma 54-interacting transcriptional regulator [Desulfopila aestuarii]|uniref:Sigma-54 interaction domain-containing protein n=1 Tax=Desulfopila aestuarii DSM 18488 TaxID=1121416 RepID=A0A1M7YB59_9BACT|nr:sigma 54-interacting transcriptional regulator [Desulfopila aestuarii]SHO49865.1 Sigma-54 interaction domain-containing protein [Desulfopila aestuarii DSM 18488]